jgi:outer membrane receptor protein involved in Fe transport
MYSRRESTSDDVTSIIEANGDNERRFYGGGVRGGIDWDISKRDNFGFSFRVGQFNMGGDSELDYIDTKIPGAVEEYFSYNESDRSGTYFSLTSNYTHKFAQKGHELAAQLNYRGYDGDEFSENFRSQNAIITDGTRTTEVGPNKRWELRLDYALPVGESDKFEAGFQGRAGIGDDETKLFNWDVDENDFVEDEQNRNTTSMDRNIYALYSVYKGQLSDFGYQLGLRGEYTDREISSSGVNETYVIDRVDFFPTLHLSYQLPSDNQVMASYSRRIDRPRGWYLEPFVTVVDQYNVRSGNPDLEPEYIDAFELGYLKKWEKIQLSLEGYYRITHDKIDRIRTPYEGNTEVFLSTYDNIGSDYSLGIEAMLNVPVAKWWEMNLMGNLYDYRIESNYDGIADRTSFNWSSRINNSFVLKKNIKLQIDGNYDSPSATAQGETKESYYMNAAVRMDFMDRKLSAVVQARDVFGTAQRIEISEGPNFYEYQKRTRNAPMVSFTLSYRLNNFIQKRGKNGNGDSGMGEDF